MAEDVVTLKGMRFHTHIGVLPHEAEVAQSIEVDVSVWVKRPAGDGPAHVADYRDLYDRAAGVLAHGHMKYLEDVAERIAEQALEARLVTRVSVSVRKPHVALPGPLAYAEVTVERRK
ncbi:MAG: dihydroneopterin aldolase [Gemmatimonadaceae bacterium]